jgi:hypothetical protein
MPRRHGSVGLFSLAALAVLAISCTSSTTGKAPQGASSGTQATTANAAKEVALPAGPQPPDGKWLVDDQGRRYFPFEIPKYEGYYIRMPNNQIQISYGTILDVLEEKEKSWVVKMYESGESAPSAAAAKPVVADPATVAATYAAKLPTVDRVQFVPFNTGLPRAGQWREHFQLIDFDGDGKLDIVFGPARKGEPRPHVFLGDGAGHWRHVAPAIGGKELDYGDVAVADFNGDGILDLAFAVHLRGVRVLVADGKGGYRDWDQGLAYEVAGHGGEPPDFTARTIRTADWNGDGKPDLVVLGEGPRLMRESGSKTPRFGAGAKGISVFLNQGDGSWKTLRSSDKQQLFGDQVEVADVDGDGRLDIVTSSSVNRGNTILNYGQPDGTWKNAAVPTLRPGITFTVALADFDGDGKLDLAVGYSATEGGIQRGGLDVHLQRPEGQWERVAIWNEAPDPQVTAIAAGDLDGDGKADMVAMTGDGRRMAFIGKGDGHFDLERTPELTQLKGCRGYSAAIRDLDGDGHGDIVLSAAGEPGSEVMFPELAMSCTSQGDLQAWRTVPAGAAQAASSH